MDLKFDPNQVHQIAAVESVLGLFTGQSLQASDPIFQKGTLGIFPNPPVPAELILLRNLQSVQRSNGLPVDSRLDFAEVSKVEDGSDSRLRFPNFSIEMETGTGKTYVYIRTALELSRRFGYTKFIVVVPSIAIREGVLKTFSITRSHFRGLFDKLPYSFYPYESDKLSQIRQFTRSAGVQFLVMTLAAFNKARNRIRQSQDSLSGDVPIEEIRVVHPILILDEPQKMASDLSKVALGSLDPLFALRYSATHREPFNLIYRLSPYDSYRQGLVKKIAVASVITEHNLNQAFLRLDSIKSVRSRLTARLAVHRLLATGEIKESPVTISDGDDLRTITGREEYSGYKVAEVSKSDGLVRFSNGIELRLSDSRGEDQASIIREQIRYTVREHLRRQERLRPQGIKVLSLFFIDHVENYAPTDSPIRQIFSEAFDEFKRDYPTWASKNPAQVQAAYFATRKRRGGEIESVESTGTTEADEAEFELIMRQKERLLSFDEPTAFIFSHSALGEGWDNPNVFFICALRNVGSEIQRRQQVGRGMRLAVDQNGSRVLDDRVNLLTVVANEPYENYVEGLQREIQDDFGPTQVPPPPIRADQGSARLIKERFASPEFLELWAKIRRRTKYSVSIDSNSLVFQTTLALSGLKVTTPQVRITKAEVSVGKEDVLVAARSGSSTVPIQDTSLLPNIVQMMAFLMEHTSPPVRITRHSLLAILDGLPQRQTALDNPQEFASLAVATIKEVLADLLVNGVKYHPTGEVWEPELFEEEWEEFMKTVGTPIRGLYDRVFVQSQIEEDFAKDLDRMEEVKLFLKLPRGFEVETPVGRYNPDWAIVWEGRDEHGEKVEGPRLYLVRETKGTIRLDQLQHSNERRKVICGRRHFTDALGVDFKVVTSARDLPDGGWP